MSERYVTRQAVFVVIENEQSEILLQQRAKTGYLDGYWDLPTGHVEPGESFQVAAAREVFEEIGVTIEPDDLHLIHLDQFSVDEDYLNLTFKALKWHGEPTLQEPDKCSALGWFALGKLPDKCVNVVRVNQRCSFSDELTYSFTDAEAYDSLINA